MMETGPNQTVTVLSVLLVTLLISGLIVGLRVYTRTILQRGAFGLDDWFIVIAWLTVLAYNACILRSIHLGYGKHNYDLSSVTYIQVVKWEVIGQFFAVLAYIPSKLSVAVCLARIFPGKKLRWILWTISVLNTVAFTYGAIIQLAQCTPAARQWDPTIDGSCINPIILTDSFIPIGSIGAASDFILAAIPWFYISRLQIPRRHKMAIGFAMSLGFVAGIFAVVKTYYITTLSSRTDYAYDTVPLVLWSIGEQCAINIAACIPLLRPFLQKLLRERRERIVSQPLNGIVTIGSGPKPRARKISDSDETTLIGMSNLNAKEIRIQQSIKVETTSI